MPKPLTDALLYLITIEASTDECRVVVQEKEAKYSGLNYFCERKKIAGKEIGAITPVASSTESINIYAWADNPDAIDDTVCELRNFATSYFQQIYDQTRLALQHISIREDYEYEPIRKVSGRAV
ncbi:hypothetical protein ACK8P5_26125 (plasmid) [Paenibacillus sp. EC2-1]|uniref:hypothetical protein n=1 Tax=Paenibacillus sp. EC2-1 TaxID=3388665 RepID=UPI003BEF0BA8